MASSTKAQLSPVDVAKCFASGAVAACAPANQSRFQYRASRPPPGSAACEQGDFAMEGPEFRAAVLKDGTRPEEVQIDMDKFNKVWPRLTVIGHCAENDKKILRFVFMT